MGFFKNSEAACWFFVSGILLFIGMVLWACAIISRKLRLAREAREREIRIKHHARMLRDKQLRKSRRRDHVDTRRRSHRQSSNPKDKPRDPARAVPYGRSDDGENDVADSGATDDTTETDSGNNFSEC